MNGAPPKASVIVFPGSNGDRDLFETFQAAGFETSYVKSHEHLPEDVNVIGLPGGFSYGDYWRAGMLASQSPAVLDIGDRVEKGALAIGICNGFQILVESGYLPGALTYNTPPSFRHRWIHLEVQDNASTPWLHGIEPGTKLFMPMAHGEGNYFHPEGDDAVKARAPLTYTSNPNGSMADAAALTDSTGRILGIMPHPERAADSTLGSDDGLALFKAARSWFDRN